MSQSEAINEIALALSKAQGEMKNPAFDRKNPHFNSRYASEAAIMDAIRPPLSKHGLAISHQTVNGTLITRLLHGSGQWLGTEWRLNASNGKPQERGSELTYGRRYNICGLVGVVGDDDDDANEATKAPTGARAKYGTTPEELIDKAEYDEEGNPVNNIPRGNPEFKKLGKKDADVLLNNLQVKMKYATDRGILKLWGESIKDEVETLPHIHQVKLREDYADRWNELPQAP